MKRLFLTILEGDSPMTARPLMASEDPAVVRAAIHEINKRMGMTPAKPEPRIPQGGGADAKHAN